MNRLQQVTMLVIAAGLLLNTALDIRRDERIVGINPASPTELSTAEVEQIRNWLVDHNDRLKALEDKPIEPSWSSNEPPPVPPPEGAVGIPTGVFEEGIAGDGTVLYRQEFMRYPELEAKK